MSGAKSYSSLEKRYVAWDDAGSREIGIYATREEARMAIAEDKNYRRRLRPSPTARRRNGRDDRRADYEIIEVDAEYPGDLSDPPKGSPRDLGKAMGMTKDQQSVLAIRDIKQRVRHGQSFHQAFQEVARSMRLDAGQQRDIARVVDMRGGGRDLSLVAGGFKPRKIVATSFERYNGGVRAKRRYGSAALTSFYVHYEGDERDPSKWVTVREVGGPTPGDRKTEAIRRSGLRATCGHKDCDGDPKMIAACKANTVNTVGGAGGKHESRRDAEGFIVKTTALGGGKGYGVRIFKGSMKIMEGRADTKADVGPLTRELLRMVQKTGRYSTMARASRERRK